MMSSSPMTLCRRRMNDYELKAFVTNLGKYNEGELVGEWVSFPVSADEMKAVLDRIQIGHPDDP